MLKERNIKIFRTDIDGVNFAISNGKDIELEILGSTVKSSSSFNSSNNGTTTGDSVENTEKREVTPQVTDNEKKFILQIQELGIIEVIVIH